MAKRNKHGLPEWKLYRNFILREIARTWYGKESVFDISKGLHEHSPFWAEFGYLFSEMAILFGRAHGLSRNKMEERLYEAIEEWELCHGINIVFREPFCKVAWRVRQMLGDRLLEKLFEDFETYLAYRMAKVIHYRVSNGEMPPYKPEGDVAGLHYYEIFFPVAPNLEKRYYGG